MAGGLPSYEDVLKEDALRGQGSQSAPLAGASSASPPPRPARPSKPARPQPSPRPPQRPPPACQSAPVSSSLPWTYPSRYYCSKCDNTGYKIKNGRSCKTCWRRFAPPNSSGSIPSLMFGNGMSMNSFGPMRPMYSGYQSGYTASNTAPMVVRPGDPRLGGVVCGECRGSGRVSFLLDEDICPLCRGIGRIIT